MNSLEKQNTQVLAHYLYKIDGRPAGRDLDYWLTAEQQLKYNLFCDNWEQRKGPDAKLGNRCVK